MTFDGEVPVLESVEYFFIAITSRFTLTWSGCTCQGPIDGSNKSVWKLIISCAKKKNDNYTKYVNMNTIL